MAINYDAYEIVVGLEVHAQLLTRTKLFCGDSASFGGEPNTHVSPVTLGHPGALPRLNRKAVEFAIKMGLACHSEIERTNYFARKNYFYPDLPKGYQISQHTTPICKGGRVNIRTDAGQRDIRLNRIHLEEDAGKSLHDTDPAYTSVDLNRAGVPLIEMVTRSPQWRRGICLPYRSTEDPPLPGYLRRQYGRRVYALRRQCLRKTERRDGAGN
jgi:aspartyl-tRNA(Asn)/glutamyl-tRNA(Gln) amidotransferase subunit B